MTKKTSSTGQDAYPVETNSEWDSIEEKTLTEKAGKYLTFSLADEEYGIGILKIKEIIGMMPVTTVQIF